MVPPIRRLEYTSDFARRFFEVGEARGKAKSVLTVLYARGVAVPVDVRDEILYCTDQERLGVWILQALTAETIQDLDDPRREPDV
ncbi:hypothetical protein [Dactylosporangium sp. CA-139066]|uniref:hypothetical protein n=1 Tax=Dactylosporangium sp. CA-139066 TaxID=3239930 RepID=UPI003D8FD068